MMRMLLWTMLLIGSAGVAQAQDTRIDSNVDSKTDLRRHESSPGTTGAMHDTSRGIAVSETDVRDQQEGKRLSADGGGIIEGRRPMQSQSPGTVGASPGSTARDRR